MSKTLFSDPASFVRAPRLTGLTASRDGRVIATRRTTNEEGSAFVDQLFDVTEEGARQLTFGTKSASLLAIGERGEAYFSRNDPGAESKGDAIWMLPPSGEAREIFRYKGGIEGLQATKNNLLLTLSVLPGANESQPDSEGSSAEEALAKSADLAKKREDAKVTAVLYERFPTRSWDHDETPGNNRLFVSPLPDLVAPLNVDEDPAAKLEADKDSSTAEKPAELPPNELDLKEIPLPPAPDGANGWELASAIATRDGSHALVTMVRRTTIDHFTQAYLMDLQGSEPPKLLAVDDSADYSGELVCPYGKAGVLARYLPPLPNQTVAVELQRVDFATGKIETLTANDPNSMAIGDEPDFFYAADRRGRGGVFKVSSSGEESLLTPDDEYVYSNLHWSAGRLVALRSSIAEPASVVFIDPVTGEITEGPHLTADLELAGELTEIEAVGVDGTPLRAWLVVPEGEGPHPLVVFAHGGPWGSWNDWTWRWNPWVFAARGYAVLLPDPGISTGYGQGMLSRGHDALGDEPFTDIMALTDVAVARDDIDRERQLFAGGSYGGYMANWVAGHAGDQFNAIVTHASLWNVESMSRTTDNGSWYRWMMGPIPKGPKAGESQAARWSPHRYVKDIQVPMLVIHGDRDYRVPIGQGLELWMDLQRTSPELDHRFLYFPDEGHWILKPGNAQVWYETFLAFLDRHASPSGHEEDGEHLQTKRFEQPELLG